MFFKSRTPIRCAQPGLVMIQVDGFSRTEFEKALDKGEMPFLKRLLHKENYRLHSFFPGLPSTTPSIQGELFYGCKQCVPSFFFFDRQTHKIFKMYDADAVLEIERRLNAYGPKLLEGGASYSNIFSGGSSEPHFCAGCLGRPYIWKDVNLKNFIIFAGKHFVVFVGIIFMLFWEIILGIVDFFYGVFKGEDIKTEFKFIFLRALLCVALREVICAGAIDDIRRGLPIIHLNLIGYDEHAHRRGPASKHAHWALRGIDWAIERIHQSASKSCLRHYDVWIYSDHGQEATTSYLLHYKRSIEEAVAESVKSVREDLFFERDFTVAAMGPVAGVYIFKDLDVEEKNRIAGALVTKAFIPLVIWPHGEHKAYAMTARGLFTLPEQASEILSKDHPFFEEAIHDLIALSHHANAGTFTICGWGGKDKAFSFPYENGAHAGPGPDETRGFALLPSDTISPYLERKYVKVIDLREAALKLLQNEKLERAYFSHSSKTSQQTKRTIRLMTYNVHSCVGMDGQFSPQRIARVIGRYQPDIVALQELDMGRKRTGAMDQPHLIAKELEMIYHFHPSIQVEEEKYGNAILSRYPIDLISAAKLPKLQNRFSMESRGAIWACVRIGDLSLQVINTHLSYYRPESLYQAKALVSDNWLKHPVCTGPVVLCGDFNCFPKSAPWQTICEHLSDVQKLLAKHKPLATWSTKYPIGRIDHVFVSKEIKVVSIDVPKSHLEKIASDHLPLIVDLEITS